MFSFRLLFRLNWSRNWLLVGGRGEDLGRDGRGHLVQVAGDAVLLQRAEGLGARGVVLDGGLVTAAPG